jgi:hypothetical protein
MTESRAEAMEQIAAEETAGRKSGKTDITKLPYPNPVADWMTAPQVESRNTSRYCKGGTPPKE